MSSTVVIDRLRTAARSLESVDHREALVAIQAAQDALDAAKAHHMAALETSADYELDGASTVTAWARANLRLEAGETKQLIRADETMRELPAVAEAAVRGEVRLEHLQALTYGIKHIGDQTIREAEPWLLEVARVCEPSQLRKTVRALREAIYPDELDQAWAEGMEKQDIQVNPVPAGWHVNGFLNQVTGAKLKKVLDSLGTPVTADDQRTGAQRRVEALDQLVTGVLENGLPSDKGIRPQISVTVDSQTLTTAMTADPGTSPQPGPAGPAVLDGFGAIGPHLLSYLGCTSDVTGVLTSTSDLPQAKILNVGRTKRLATPAQRRAVILRQGGVCAGNGCRSTHLEIHHKKPWSQGGNTDIDDLIGYCPACHHLEHRGLLTTKAPEVGRFDQYLRRFRPQDATSKVPTPLRR